MVNVLDQQVGGGGEDGADRGGQGAVDDDQHQHRPQGPQQLADHDGEHHVHLGHHVAVGHGDEGQGAGDNGNGGPDDAAEDEGAEGHLLLGGVDALPPDVAVEDFAAGEEEVGAQVHDAHAGDDVHQLGLGGHDAGVNVGGAELHKGQHGGHQQHDQDQHGHNKVGGEDGLKASLDGVDGAHRHNQHQPHVVVHAGQGLEQDAAAHGLGHEEAGEVPGGDQQEHDPYRLAVAAADKVAAGAAVGHDFLDAQGQGREDAQAQPGGGVAEAGDNADGIALLGGGHGGVAGNPCRQQRGGGQGQAHVPTGVEEVVGALAHLFAYEEAEGQQHNGNGADNDQRQRGRNESFHKISLLVQYGAARLGLLGFILCKGVLVPVLFVPVQDIGDQTDRREYPQAKDQDCGRVVDHR